MEYTYYESLPSCSENNYLPGYVISESVVPTWLHCFTLCLASNICRSVNIWQNPGYISNVTCQLNWHYAGKCIELQSTTGVKYYPMSFTSCADVHRLLPFAVDGEFYLDLGTGRLAQVYCHGMNTSNPLVSYFIRMNCEWLFQLTGAGIDSLFSLYKVKFALL